MEVLGALLFPARCAIAGSLVAVSSAQVVPFGKFRRSTGAGWKWARLLDRGGDFIGLPDGEIDQTNRPFLPHSPAAGSCSRC